LDNELVLLEIEYSNIKSKREVLEKEYNEYKKRSFHLLSEADSELKQELNQRQEQKCFVDNHNERLQADIDNMQSNIEELEKRNKTFKEEVKEAQKNAEIVLELKNELDINTERLKEQSSMVVAESYKIKMLEKGNAHLKEETRKLTEQLEKYEEEEGKMSKETAEIEMNSKEIEKDCYELRQKNKELRNKLEEILNLNEDFATQLNIEGLINQIKNTLHEGIDHTKIYVNNIILTQK